MTSLQPNRQFQPGVIHFDGLEVVRGAGPKAAAFNLGQAENFRRTNILRARIFLRPDFFGGG
jgi:hypothetical protein